MAISSPNVVQGKENPVVSALKYANDAIKQSFTLMQNAKQLGLQEKDMNYQKNLEVLKSAQAMYAGFETQFGPMEAWNRTRRLFGSTWEALGMDSSVFQEVDQAILNGDLTPQDMQTAAFNVYLREPRGTLSDFTTDDAKAAVKAPAESATSTSTYAAASKTLTSPVEDRTDRAYSDPKAYREPTRVVDKTQDSPYNNARAWVQDLYKKTFKPEVGEGNYVASLKAYRKEYDQKVSDFLFDPDNKLTTDERVAILEEIGKQVANPSLGQAAGGAFGNLKRAVGKEYAAPEGMMTDWAKGNFALPKVEEPAPVAPDAKTKDASFWNYMQNTKDMGPWKGISAEDAAKQGLIEKAKVGNPGALAAFEKNYTGLPEAFVTPGKLIPSTVALTGPDKPLNDATRKDWQANYAKQLTGQKDAEGRPIDARYAENLAYLASTIPPTKTTTVARSNEPIVKQAAPPTDWQVSGGHRSFTPSGIAPDTVDGKATWNFGRAIYDRFAKNMAGVEFGKGDAIRYSNATRDYLNATPGMREIKADEINNYMAFLGSGNGALGRERLNIAMHQNVYALETQRMGEERLGAAPFTIDKAVQDMIGVHLDGPLNADQMGAFASIFSVVASYAAATSGTGMSDAEWKEYTDHADRADKINAELWAQAGGKQDKYIQLQNERMVTDNNFAMSVQYLQMYYQSRHGVEVDADGNIVKTATTESRATTSKGFLGLGALLNPSKFNLQALPTFQFKGQTPAPGTADGIPAQSSEATGYLDRSGYKRVTTPAPRQ